MTEKDLQALHVRAACGETLTNDEQAALQNWYRRLDQEEAVILKSVDPLDSNEELKSKIRASLKRVAEISRHLEETMTENDRIRAEIAKLQELLAAKHAAGSVS